MTVITRQILIVSFVEVALPLEWLANCIPQMMYRFRVALTRGLPICCNFVHAIINYIILLNIYKLLSMN